MWRPHMMLHAQNILPGDVPFKWLEEQDSFICCHCHYIVASSRAGSHSAKCRGPATEAGVHQALHTHPTVGPGSGRRDLWVLENRNQGLLLSSSSLAGLTATLQRVQSLGQHLPTTQPHFGSLRSQNLTFTCRHPDHRGLKTLV